jgi:peptidoglycan/LPS O-acetylase OafA/YrhL
MKIFYSVEILRFFSSISILLYHYKHFFYPFSTLSIVHYDNIEKSLPFYYFLNFFYIYGSYGVQLFYCISGFVFSHVYLLKKNNVNFLNFFGNRFARLYPLHLLTLAIVFILQFINLRALGSYQGLIQFNDFFHFILQFFFISAWGFELGHSFNAPIWSVSIEFVIYFIFFLLIRNINKYKFYFLAFLIIFLLLIKKSTHSNNLFLECAQLFFSGVLIYLLFLIPISRLFLSVFALVLLLLSFIGNFKIFIFCPSLLLLFLTIEPFVEKFFFKSLFKILGSLTYSIYLIHFPLQLLVILFFNIFLVSSDIFISKSFFFAFFSVLLAVSYFSYKYFEYPLNKLIKSKFSY